MLSSSLCPILQPHQVPANLANNPNSRWTLMPEARRISQLVVDTFRKSSKDHVQVVGPYQPMDDPSGSSASTPGAVARGRKQSVHVYRQDSEKLAGKLAEKLESVVDRPDGEQRENSVGSSSRGRKSGAGDNNNWTLLPAASDARKAEAEASQDGL